MNKNDKQLEPSNESRRNFLRSGASMSAAVGLVGAASIGTSTAYADDFSVDQGDASLDGGNRAQTAAKLKRELANQQRNETFQLGDQKDNNDEQRYSSERFYASFYKTLLVKQRHSR